MNLRGKHILLGVTGSIAAYKSAVLVREFVKAGAEVRVVMTPSAVEFITPLTLATLSQAEVVVDMFPAEPSKGTWHIHLAMWADLMLIAPASANTIAKLAHGLADNALTALALAMRCPLLLAPAMDTDMYTHAATQENIHRLRHRGVGIIEPESGDLASGLVGPGRLPDSSVLLQAISERLTQSLDLNALRVLITAGPTRERIDPVRFIGNMSSGKMGFALAEAASRRGALVQLVAGPVALPTPPGVERIDVESAQEMFDVVVPLADESDICILAAAVADYAPAVIAEQKIKKSSDVTKGLMLQLVRTPDILSRLGESGKAVLVGFALETENEIEHARRKLKEKHADIIVLNNPTVEGAEFGAETNIATLLMRDETVQAFERMTKIELANRILDRALAIFRDRDA